MFTRDKSQLLNEELSRMGNNTYFCYKPKNKQASLSSRSQYFIQTDPENSIHAKHGMLYKIQCWNHQYLNFFPVWEECLRNLTALQNTTVLTIPGIHNLIYQMENTFRDENHHPSSLAQPDGADAPLQQSGPAVLKSVGTLWIISVETDSVITRASERRAAVLPVWVKTEHWRKYKAQRKKRWGGYSRAPSKWKHTLEHLTHLLF